MKENCDTQMATSATLSEEKPPAVDVDAQSTTTPTPTATATPTPTLLPLLGKQLLFCRRFKDAPKPSAAATTTTTTSDGFLRNFNSLPLFVYATSPSTHATSADGVGVAREAAAYSQKNDGFELAATHGTSQQSHQSQSQSRSRSHQLAAGAMECLPLGGGHLAHHLMAGNGANSSASSHLHHPHHQLLSHHSPYSNSYALHHSGGHHHIHSEQAKSLQELQHEVGALLEFRDLVIETFPDLKHKMASMSVTSNCVASVGAISAGGSHSVGNQAARREWEPGIRSKRKLSHKEPSTASATEPAASAPPPELSSSSLTRSRSNSHSGKKEPKSGENNNGSVVQDSGFSTETSSSKEGHSASSTNGAMTVAIASNRLSCAESDDELLNLLDVIHRKSNRLREEVEQLQSYERQQLDASATPTSSSKGQKAAGMTPQQFREQVERLNREDMRQLRRERDRLLDKLAEMEAETLTGRIKAAKMSDQMEELISVKKDLEEQLKLAMAQKLELSSRVQQLQGKSSSSGSQSEYSSQRNFLSSATTVLSNGSSGRPNTFQPVVVSEQPAAEEPSPFHQSSVSDTTTATASLKRQPQSPLGRLDGIVSTPGARNTKCRITDSKRFAAILLETNVLELQRHLLTLTVQNQVLLQKLDASGKSKTHLVKRLDKSSEDMEDLRFQLEEKNIELEGTKAQLRVLESRMHASIAPPSGTNSYLNSQNDYETNRSSASTTLMLSRVEATSSAMPPPPAKQISTPSMKAMVHLPMDELQQHSSSTESAHEHELTQHEQSKTITNINMSPLSPLGSSTPTTTTSQIMGRIMSASAGGMSPFEQTPPRGHAFRKFATASKPSKIPLPGSKAAAYFSGKPPTGRASNAGRSPPSANNSSNSYGSSKSSLSRSTGNLIYGKSPQSLKRADSAQSMRKDASNHSLSTNTSRSSTSSSIPLATTPYSSSSGNRTANTTSTTTPSPRVLQNSPLPKLKRETLTSRVRHLDSLSRAQHETPAKPQASASSIAAQLNSTLRKDLQLSSAQAQPFQRRATANGHGQGHGLAERSQSGVARRFSSASAGGGGARLLREQVEQATAAGGGGGVAINPLTTPTSSYGDSDSGKNLVNANDKPNFRFNDNNWQLWQTCNKLSNNNGDQEATSGEAFHRFLSQHEASEETAYDSCYTQYTTPDSMDCGSDNLLVTFDYGYSDSIPTAPAAEEDAAIWFAAPPEEDFEVHHVQHKLGVDSLQSLISYDVDDFEAPSAEEDETDQDQEPDAENFYDSIECA